MRNPCPVSAALPSATRALCPLHKEPFIGMIGRAENRACVALRLGEGRGSRSVSHSLDWVNWILDSSSRLLFPSWLTPVPVLKEWTSSTVLSAWVTVASVF